MHIIIFRLTDQILIQAASLGNGSVLPKIYQMHILIHGELLSCYFEPFDDVWSSVWQSSVEALTR